MRERKKERENTILAVSVKKKIPAKQVHCPMSFQKKKLLQGTKCRNYICEKKTSLGYQAKQETLITCVGTEDQPWLDGKSHCTLTPIITETLQNLFAFPSSILLSRFIFALPLSPLHFIFSQPQLCFTRTASLARC